MEQERLDETLAEMRRRWQRNREAMLMRCRWRLLAGGRLGLPKELDAVQLEPRPRPELRVIDGGRAHEPREVVPPIEIEVPLPPPSKRSQRQGGRR